jgi:hypothetical protein
MQTDDKLLFVIDKIGDPSLISSDSSPPVSSKITVITESGPTTRPPSNPFNIDHIPIDFIPIDTNTTVLKNKASSRNQRRRKTQQRREEHEADRVEEENQILADYLDNIDEDDMFESNFSAPVLEGKFYSAL